MERRGLVSVQTGGDSPMYTSILGPELDSQKGKLTEKNTGLYPGIPRRQPNIHLKLQEDSQSCGVLHC